MIINRNEQLDSIHVGSILWFDSTEHYSRIKKMRWELRGATFVYPRTVHPVSKMLLVSKEKLSKAIRERLVGSWCKERKVGSRLSSLSLTPSFLFFLPSFRPHLLRFFSGVIGTTDFLSSSVRAVTATGFCCVAVRPTPRWQPAPARARAARPCPCAGTPPLRQFAWP